MDTIYPVEGKSVNFTAQPAVVQQDIAWKNGDYSINTDVATNDKSDGSAGLKKWRRHGRLGGVQGE